MRTIAVSDKDKPDKDKPQVKHTASGKDKAMVTIAVSDATSGAD
eukprot:CAMPEP_0172583374 /NCGR_PEP_ID=MMETSP1068-20121228/2999_1 /TAXON_ID=35684 /ORGANISM="Pseudopedinella elastica, Strain CCMP716" /LENGTH=43 /DNA_ID= /DNA_START= /DNA_END= /DNA_ORIENTATION=